MSLEVIASTEHRHEFHEKRMDKYNGRAVVHSITMHACVPPSPSQADASYLTSSTESLCNKDEERELIDVMS